LFPRFGDAGLAVDGGATEWLALDTVAVTPLGGPVPALPHARLGSFTSGAWLTGYGVGSEIPAGAPFEVDLSWQGVETDRDVGLAWVDADGREAEAAVFPLAAGAVRSHHVVAAPQGPGDYMVHVGLVGEAARCGWLASPTDGCALFPVAVTPAQEGLANFADRVVLLEADVSAGDGGSVSPGGAVSVVLRWRALRAMAEDYTAFVHLVGPDGQLHGQVDAWPVQGTLPTSRWVAGEELDDPYEVALDPDAPPGQYRVEVGWYLLATMQRLQVVDVGGQAVGDAFVVGGFDVGD
jgi:hypothetical protein